MAARILEDAAKQDLAGDKPDEASVKQDAANAIAVVLAPGGAAKLNAGATRPLTITMDADLRKALEEAAEEFGVHLNQLAEEAYRKVLAGEWVPQKVGTRKITQRAVLNVSVYAELRDQVQEMLPGLSEKHGRRISEGAIVVRWACEELGVDTGTGLMVPLFLPLALRDHFQAARDAGTSLEGIVEERVGELMAGSWQMPRPSKARKATRGAGGWGKFSVRVSDPVRRDLQELAASLSESMGARVSPSTVIRQILVDRLGEPAE
ncbi:hypothetical protein AB0F30_17150 [Streptomyces sp. NPDC029006]|uniref:hypothetical protein n=1 Tax=Streptomyces sp. NPDC029006 TaxID=3155467 RepID=UPI0033C808D5